MSIHRKLVVDDHGRPKEVIIPWKEFLEIENLLGLDLTKKAIEDLKKARKDRESDRRDAYIDLDAI
ncbi:hypothetical protein KJ656_03210 [bacterium]|nr:hypothetical protein [bacterium]